MWQFALAGEVRGIFFFAALYALLLIGYSVVYQIRVLRWPSTRGMLLAQEIEKVGGTDLARWRQDYAVNALYRYSVAGEDFEGRRLSPWVMIASHNARFVLRHQLKRLAPDADGVVQVYFKPGNPAKSFLLKPGLFGIALTAVLAVGPMLVYWWQYHG